MLSVGWVSVTINTIMMNNNILDIECEVSVSINTIMMNNIFVFD